MSLWILYQKPTGRNRVGKSLPILFSIVRTAGASPAELTNEKSYVRFFTKFIASCPSLLALISAAGANPVGKSLPIMFAIVRTAGASPAELTNE